MGQPEQAVVQPGRQETRRTAHRRGQVGHGLIGLVMQGRTIGEHDVFVMLLLGSGY
jgi:hypothetical protein